MLRTRSPVRPLAASDRDAALALCARNRVANVFAAARLGEAGTRGNLASALGHYRGGDLSGLAWVSANVVPVELDEEGLAATSAKIARHRRQCASIFGPSDQVASLWERLAPGWGPARTVRTRQPLMSSTTRPSSLGLDLDESVRPARVDEVDIVLPAAEHMFTEEIGYPPYFGSDRGYRAALSTLIRQGHTFVRVEQGEVVFKADLGSLALGCAQIQGVWLHPRLRGQGRAVVAMATVVELVLNGLAQEVSLYVNDFNSAARATYERCGFTGVGSFSTVLL